MSKVKIIGETSIDKKKLEDNVVQLIKARLMSIKNELEEIDKDLIYFSRRYEMDSDEFIKKFNEGTIGDEEDYFIWEGSLKVRNKLLEEQRNLSEIV
ncbi:MAG: hypothetical protein ACFFCQ_06255 [Promethearchaeota archaeon]